ncbi:MAG: peptidoglycan DD-metalloendopeptidase family protein, partial [Propionibacteriaceae bacterium]|nr:peptidoglycan DD-metalloendopeptidase family protein [Propionibacteriaceae bacterium]
MATKSVWVTIAAISAAVVISLGIPIAQADPGGGESKHYANYTAAELRQELLKLEEEQRDIANRKVIAEERLRVANERVELTRALIEDQKAQLAVREAQLNRIALQRYQDSGVNTTVVLMMNGSTSETLNRLTVLQQVTDTASSLLTSLRLEQSSLEDMMRSEQAAITIIEAEQIEIATLDEEALVKVVQVSALLNSMRGLTVAGGLFGYNAAGAGVVNPEELIPNPSLSLKPVQNSFIETSPYGPRIDPFGRGLSFHDGYDMASPCGSVINSAANGYVMDYFWAGSYGNRLVIDHGVIDGKHVVVSNNHVSGSLVKPGSQVEQGQPVALVGSTGASTGCHNHYMIWMDGQIVDPT